MGKTPECFECDKRGEYYCTKECDGWPDEHSFEKSIVIVHVDDRESRLAGQYGVNIASGSLLLTWPQARDLILALDCSLTGGIIYKKNENRLRALRNSLLWAFGPEAESEYRMYTKLFKPTPEG